MTNITIQVRARKPGFAEGHRRKGEVFQMSFVTAPASLADFPAWVSPVDWTPDEVEGGVTLADALDGLNHAEPSHWNGDGRPDLNYLKEVMGHRVKRGEVDDLAPDLVRVDPSAGDGGE